LRSRRRRRARKNDNFPTHSNGTLSSPRRARGTPSKTSLGGLTAEFSGDAPFRYAAGLNICTKKAEDMTAPTTSAAPKIALDQRAPSSSDEFRKVCLGLSNAGGLSLRLRADDG